MSNPPRSDEDAFGLPPEETRRRYYFDFQDGTQFTSDDTGVALDEGETVRREAIRAMCAIAKDTF